MTKSRAISTAQQSIRLLRPTTRTIVLQKIRLEMAMRENPELRRAPEKDPISELEAACRQLRRATKRANDAVTKIERINRAGRRRLGNS